MEYRDLYDENRKLTGEKIKKDDIVPKGKYYITVVVWIENSNNEFLLQINKKYNMWATTGGHPKFGEDSLDGIVTEIKEELGIDVDRDKLKLFKTIKTEDDFVDLYYLKEDIKLDCITKQEEEVSLVKWFSIDKINDLISNNSFLPAHVGFFYECLEFLKGSFSMMDYEQISDECKMLWKENFNITDEKYTQVYCYIFNDENKLLIVKNKENDNWTIPGGPPEINEEKVDALKREVLEEACITVKDIKYLGAVEVIENNIKYYQLRYTARVDEVLPFKEEFEISERLFVRLSDLDKYITWANGKTFSAQILSARKYWNI